MIHVIIYLRNKNHFEACLISDFPFRLANQKATNPVTEYGIIQPNPGAPTGFTIL